VEQDAQVDSVLKELEADRKPRLHVRNKIDLLAAAERDALRDDGSTVHVSAMKGIGLTTLLDRVDQVLAEDPVSRVHLRIPQKEGKTLSLIEARSRVYSRQYKDGLVELEAEAPESVIRRVQDFLVEES
jgi:50S ribosomal subunit-associated GTPase HflX